jgi:endonuclease G
MGAALNATEICHAGYALLHDDDLLIARWVAYHLTGDHTFGCIPRTDNFHAEKSLPANRRAQVSDYDGSGYSKGHFAPAQDFAWNLARMKDSFSMVNMAPQIAGLNQRQWLRLEETVRSWAADRKELIIYVGPFILNPKRTIGRWKVVIPTAFWKVVVDPTRSDALAFVTPQEDIAKGKLEVWQVSVDLIEGAAGLTLPLPKQVDRGGTPSLWVTDLAKWRRKKRIICGD